ncbi:MAG TPA: class I SAM-dependent methyltransferase [Thermoplasmata archaeon]
MGIARVLLAVGHRTRAPCVEAAVENPAESVQGRRHPTDGRARKPILIPTSAILKRTLPVHLASMGSYYEDRLYGSKLKQVYDLASPRIRLYLDSEVRYVIEQVQGASRVLELGCGYGRVVKEIAPHVARMAGNDISRASLELAASYLRSSRNCDLFRMDASQLAFRDDTFDAVICIQNGISAFGRNRHELVAEAVRVAKRGGVILFSSYSPQIWADRLDWFRAQSGAGLLGEIDESRTMDGTIVCKDGFRATTVDGEEFRALFAEVGLSATVREVDGSSVFARAVKNGRG